MTVGGVQWGSVRQEDSGLWSVMVGHVSWERGHPVRNERAARTDSPLELILRPLRA